MPKRVSMFDREFEEEAPSQPSFRVTLRLSADAYSKLRALENLAILKLGLRPSSVTRSRIVSLAIEVAVEDQILQHLQRATPPAKHEHPSLP